MKPNTKNLEILRQHLVRISEENKSDNFHMGKFFDDLNIDVYRNTTRVYPEQKLKDLDFCGTSACVVGHATAVLPVRRSDFRHKDKKGVASSLSYIDYSNRVFSLDKDIHEADSRGTWDFLFDANWGTGRRKHDLQQAINRLGYVIVNGKPPDVWGYGEEYIELEVS